MSSSSLTPPPSPRGRFFILGTGAYVVFVPSLLLPSSPPSPGASFCRALFPAISTCDSCCCCCWIHGHPPCFLRRRMLPGRLLEHTARSRAWCALPEGHRALLAVICSLKQMHDSEHACSRAY
ncbi:unnamed protein product [Ectocarpus sp. 12 AP-2014]